MFIYCDFLCHQTPNKGDEHRNDNAKNKLCFVLPYMGSLFRLCTIYKICKIPLVLASYPYFCLN